MALSVAFFSRSTVLAGLRRFLRAGLDLVLPPVCLMCHAPVGQADGLCPVCWGRMARIAPPQCACCGVPFSFPVAQGTLCGRCLARPPVFARARAALLYDAASRALLLRLKYADATYLAPALGAWMATAGAEFFSDADLLVPMPLHRWRQWRRRYNQAALLAVEIGKKTGVPVNLDVLVRMRATKPQGQGDAAWRRANVRGAFAVVPGRRLDGLHIVLVDDVLTTGASADAAAQVLLAAGAARVDVLTLAIVPHDT